MKKLIYLTLAMVFILASCKKSDSTSTPGPNELSGDNNVAFNTVGNTFTPSIIIGGTLINIDPTIMITQTTNGVATIQLKADLTQVPELAQINNLIPAIYKDSQGKVNTNISWKALSDGMLDYTNKDKAPFMLCKYDCNVGDKYTLTKSDGTTITRTVTQKSTDDDFYYGGMLIKTITIEQDSRMTGIKKIVYRVNHKFGLVYIQAVAEDGSSVGGYLFPSTY
jgi:hypothetical protein